MAADRPIARRRGSFVAGNVWRPAQPDLNRRQRRPIASSECELGAVASRTPGAAVACLDGSRYKQATNARATAAAAVLLTLLPVCSSSAVAGHEVVTPQGRVAVALPGNRGYLITDFQGRAQRRITLPRGRTVLARPAFNGRGSRLWFLSASRGRRPHLHVVPAEGRRTGRSYPVDLTGAFTTRVFVSPKEDRIAIGNAPPDTSGCGAAMVFSPTARRIRRLSAAGKIGTVVSSWSRAGSRLAYALNRWDECGRVTPSARLFVTSQRAARPDRQVAAQADGDFGPVAWSPDARRIAFPQCDGGTLTCRLVIFEIATGARKVWAGTRIRLRRFGRPTVTRSSRLAPSRTMGSGLLTPTPAACEGSPEVAISREPRPMVAAS